MLMLGEQPITMEPHAKSESFHLLFNLMFRISQERGHYELITAAEMKCQRGHQLAHRSTDTKWQTHK